MRIIEKLNEMVKRNNSINEVAVTCVPTNEGVFECITITTFTDKWDYVEISESNRIAAANKMLMDGHKELSKVIETLTIEEMVSGKFRKRKMEGIECMI